MRKKIVIGVIIILVTFVIASLLHDHIVKKFERRSHKRNVFSNILRKDNEESLHELSPVEVGNRLTQGACEGEGAELLSVSPIKLEDIGVLVPYGSTINDHVTPIDHQYFYPKVFQSAPNTYEVRAMADGTVYYIDEYRIENQFDDREEYIGDYGLKFAQSCTHLYWYGLLTDLSPKLKKALGKQARPGEVAQKYVSVDVKAGEVVGWIGGQTLDFAVLDTTKPLQGFITPELYTKEREKIFTADPFDYYTDDLKNRLMQKNPRKVEPVGGKIDYDIPGKIRGNWFVKGKGGFNKKNPEGRHEFHHLAIYPDHFDPRMTVISVGDFNGEPMQFGVFEKTDPAQVGVGDGLIKYTLAILDWTTNDGRYWDGVSYQGQLNAVTDNRVEGCALFEMIEKQLLKAEFIPGVSCDNVTTFSDNMKTYER